MAVICVDENQCGLMCSLGKRPVSASPNRPSGGSHARPNAGRFFGDSHAPCGTNHLRGDVVWRNLALTLSGITRHHAPVEPIVHRLAGCANQRPSEDHPANENEPIRAERNAGRYHPAHESPHRREPGDWLEEFQHRAGRRKLQSGHLKNGLGHKCKFDWTSLSCQQNLPSHRFGGRARFVSSKGRIRPRSERQARNRSGHSD